MCNIQALILIFLGITVINAEPPIVETTHGKVQGKVLKTLLKNEEYFGFMGIPYAAPPVKEMRFLVRKNADLVKSIHTHIFCDC